MLQRGIIPIRKVRRPNSIESGLGRDPNQTALRFLRGPNLLQPPVQFASFLNLITVVWDKIRGDVVFLDSKVRVFAIAVNLVVILDVGIESLESHFKAQIFADTVNQGIAAFQELGELREIESCFVGPSPRDGVLMCQAETKDPFGWESVIVIDNFLQSTANDVVLFVSCRRHSRGVSGGLEVQVVCQGDAAPRYDGQDFVGGVAVERNVGDFRRSGSASCEHLGAIERPLLVFGRQDEIPTLVGSGENDNEGSKHAFGTRGILMCFEERALV